VTIEFRARRKLGAFAYEAEFQAAEQIVVLFGHSGAGKSITLQMTSGLMKPDEGRIVVDGEVVFDSAARINRPPQERRVGYVVQDLALFSHLSVAENVAFGMPRSEDRKRRTQELLALLQLAGFEDRRPRTLSGGQQQRVALARALARNAHVLLLDEPFSALDESLRAGLRRELLRLKAELGLTILFVTHDLREAHLLADRLAVFDEGKLLQVGPRDDVFKRPASRRVGELTGVSNIWRGVVAACDPGRVRVEVAGLMLEARTAGKAFSCGDAVDVLVRAERINLRREHAGSSHGQNMLRAVITEEFAFGPSHTLRMAPEGAGPPLEVELAARPDEVLGVAAQKRWLAEIPPEDIHIAPSENQ
jgi:molybdate transport system ATP-binding protein